MDKVLNQAVRDIAADLLPVSRKRTLYIYKLNEKDRRYLAVATVAAKEGHFARDCADKAHAQESKENKLEKKNEKEVKP